MRLPEKVTYTLPFCDASAMKIVAKLLSGSLDGETLLETEQLNVKLSMVCEISCNLVSIVLPVITPLPHSTSRQTTKGYLDGDIKANEQPRILS